MEANLPLTNPPDTPPPALDELDAPDSFPYANWGVAAALFGVLLALVTGLLLSMPIFLVESPGEGDDLSTPAAAAAQFATALGFVIVPLVIAARGWVTVPQALRNLGLRAFRPWSSLGWMGLAIVAYLAVAIAYVALVGEPHQEDIAEDFGSLPVQVLLVVFAAGFSEELCFRGMLFGGLRNRIPPIWAALLSAVVFGALHAVTGISAVPPLIAFGFILALLYEKTGSIVPGILLHMLNNSIALLAQ